jgi:hypothetical protein
MVSLGQLERRQVVPCGGAPETDMSRPPQSTSFVPRSLLLWSLLATAFLTLALAAPASAALPEPIPAAPLDGEVLDGLPVFSWEAVPGAAKYEFEIAADDGFNSPVLGATYDHFFTRNTRATVRKTVPNGTYFWRVRAIDADSLPGAWTPAMSFGKEWAASPGLQQPFDAGTLIYPDDPFKLVWDSVPGAWNYRVTVSDSPDLSTSFWSTGSVDTQARTLDALEPVAPGTYFWRVTPLDPEKNPGYPSDVRSFEWEWPSETNTYVEDIVADAELDDWRLSWDPVPGAARYELEINPAVDFAQGSRVCCYNGFGNPDYSLGTTFTRTIVLPNNHYYWRVRAVDPNGNPGTWNYGPEFTKTYDNVPPVAAPSVKDFRLRDNLGDPGTDVDPDTPGYQTDAPMLSWSPVVGASSYEIEVVPHTDGALSPCNWSAPASDHWDVRTTATSWTPLGANWVGNKPYPSTLPVANEANTELDLGRSYCARVRPIDRASSSFAPPAFGDWTYLPGGANDTAVPAFTFTNYAAGGACSPSCTAGFLGSEDYLEPLRATTVGEMPVFTWRPIAGAQSYYVLVAREPNFTTIIDYAFTRVPAYAPRTHTATRGYADETTKYYWAILPAAGADGSGSTGDPLSAAASSFEKQTVPPEIVSPTNEQQFLGPVTFRWSPVTGVRHYFLEVSKDPTFSSWEEQVATDSTEFTSNESYAADTILYWRVRADLENDAEAAKRIVGLTWSAVGTFRKRLATPTLHAGNPIQGTAVPTWEWDHVPGAVSYDVQVGVPNATTNTATTKTFSGVPTTSFTLGLMKGTGRWTWKVRANFPTSSNYTTVDGPWTATQEFVRTIPEPTNATQSVSGGSVSFGWDPQPARLYRVQVSALPDFSRLVEHTTTDNTSYAPTLTQSAYAGGGTFYWRVAAADDVVGNVGDYTGGKAFTLSAASGGGAGTALKQFKLSAKGYLVKNRLRTITIFVKNRSNGKAVGSAMVSAYGSGVSPKSRMTGSKGSASFSLKPTRLGSVTFRVSKTGYATKYLYKKVRSS